MQKIVYQRVNYDQTRANLHPAPPPTACADQQRG
jgi:hypothetical protein